MNYTVEEAKTKWCPMKTKFMKVGVLTATQDSNCIADSCMAWIIVEKEGCNGRYYPTKEIKGYCSLCHK